jgi:MATE family multidrug resistance protein
MRTLRDLLRLALSVLVGQLAVIGFGVADTVMLGNYSTTASLATLSIGQAVYITLFVSLSGVTQSLLPTLGRSHGAGAPLAVGSGVRQGLWLVAALSAAGILVLLWPQPLLALTGQAHDPAVDRYLALLAVGLPAALAFRVHAALSQAISRPLLTAALQLGGLFVKLLLNALFLLPDRFGLQSLTPLGATGCALATVLTQYGLLAVALLQHRHSAALKPFGVLSRWEWPDWRAQAHLLRLGGPIGLSLLVEVSAFTFMALFIARLGNTVLAAHQITASFATVLYMLPLSISIATASVVAQHLGAGNTRAARHTAWTGVSMAALLAVVVGGVVWIGRAQIIGWYTSNAQVQAVANHLFLFIALYQIFDAVQSSSAFVLRAYHIAVLPSLLYALSLWGIGLGGGYALGFDVLGITPPALQGAPGFWMGNTTGLAVAATCFVLLLWRAARRP